MQCGHKANVTSKYSGISLLMLMSCAVSGYIHTGGGMKWDDSQLNPAFLHLVQVSELHRNQLACRLLVFVCQFTSLYLCSVCSYTCTSSKSYFVSVGRGSYLHTGVLFSFLFN